MSRKKVCEPKKHNILSTIVSRFCFPEGIKSMYIPVGQLNAKSWIYLNKGKKWFPIPNKSVL